MKIVFLRIIVGVALVTLSGCSLFNRKTKPSAKLYEGDESPTMKMFEENPGGPLNPM